VTEERLGRRASLPSRHGTLPRYEKRCLLPTQYTIGTGYAHGISNSREEHAPAAKRPFLTSIFVTLYAWLHWYVIPLCWPAADGSCGCGRGHIGKDIGKAPLVKWKHRVSEPPTTEEIARWFCRWPHANVGVLLRPSGLLIADFDSADARQEALHRGMPEGPLAWTGDWAKHAYLRRPEGISGRVIHRGTSGNIDVLADGYVVAPPSLHRSGGIYRFDPSPRVLPFPDPPQWALDLLTNSQQGRPRVTAPKPPPAADTKAFDIRPTYDINHLPVTCRIRDVIQRGRNADPRRYQSRSEAVFAAAVALIRAGWEDNAIAGVLLDPRFGISQKPREAGPGWLAAELVRARAKTHIVPETSPRWRGTLRPDGTWSSSFSLTVVGS
jgi:hypothetical protein